MRSISISAPRARAGLGEHRGEAGTSWDRVVKTTVYLNDMADFPRVNEVYAEAVGGGRPAPSTVAVSRLPRRARMLARRPRPSQANWRPDALALEPVPPSV